MAGLSETTLIVICVGGVLVVLVVVVALIVCITHKHKDDVTRLPPRQRVRRPIISEPRREVFVLPKPPPYSETPPQYDTIHSTDIPEPVPTPYGQPHGTPVDRLRGRISSQQQPMVMRQPVNFPSDAPPSYSSAVGCRQPHQHSSANSIPAPVEETEAPSPMPGTSTETQNNERSTTLSRVNDTTNTNLDRDAEQATVVVEARSSPHPSLVSGRISTFAYNRDGSVRPRVNSEFTSMSRLDSTAYRSSRSVSRNGSSKTPRRNRSNRSASPVTIREISVHNDNTVFSRQTNNGTSLSRGKTAKKTRIPIPVTNTRQEEEDNEAQESGFESDERVPSANRQWSTQSEEVRNSGFAQDEPQPSTSHAHQNTRYADDIETQSQLPAETPWPETPPLVSASAAARSVQRKIVLQRLKSIKVHAISPDSDD